MARKLSAIGLPEGRASAHARPLARKPARLDLDHHPITGLVDAFPRLFLSCRKEGEPVGAGRPPSAGRESQGVAPLHQHLLAAAQVTATAAGGASTSTRAMSWLEAAFHLDGLTHLSLAKVAAGVLGPRVGRC